jgi:Fe-S-cluster containining protein
MKIFNTKSYNISFITKTTNLPETDVPCGECNKCCSLSPHLTTEEFESGKYAYTFYKVDGEDNPVVAIPRNKNGCMYLIENKCSIYADRPLSCKQFDCRQGHYLPLIDWAREKFGESNVVSKS